MYIIYSNFDAYLLSVHSNPKQMNHITCVPPPQMTVNCKAVISQSASSILKLSIIFKSN